MSSAERAPLLLHSLAEFGDLLTGIVDTVAPRRIVEIGSEEAAFSRDLVAWAETHGATVDTIDPVPTPGLLQLERESSCLTVHKGLSLEVLPTLPAADLYVIDGDHNYFTVHEELRLASGAHDDEPSFVAILHDVGWPCARRDQYYAPDTIPAEHRHPHTYDAGVVPGNPGVVPGGFRGEGEFAAATHEGGPRNGVLTAVEDFLEARPGWDFALVPAVFGLGLLHPAAGESAARLRTLIGPLDRNPMLERLEQNRLALYLHVLHLQDELGRVDRDLSALVHEVHAELAAAHVELAALRARHSEVVAEADRARVDLEAANAARDRLVDVLDEIARSRAFPAAEAISRLHGLVSGHPGITRERLRALVREWQT